MGASIRLVLEFGITRSPPNFPLATPANTRRTATVQGGNLDD